MATPAIPLPQYGAAGQTPENPQEIPGGLRDMRVPEAATGAPLAEGLAHLGATAEDIGLGIKQRLDAQRVQDADTAFGQEVLKRLYDPAHGVFAQHGAAAGAAYAQSQQDLGAYRDDIADRLDDPAQREQFQRAAAERLFQFGHLAGGHVVREADDAAAESAQASNLLSSENAVAAIAHADPSTLTQAVQLAQVDRDRVVGTAQSRAGDALTASAAASAATTPFDQHVIDTLISGGHIDAAQGWFAAHADTMLPSVRTGMATALQAATRTRDANAISAQHAVADAAAVPGAAAGAQTLVPKPEFMRRVMDDPRLGSDDALRQQVIDRGESLYWQRDQAAAAAVQDLRTKAWQSFTTSRDGISDPVFHGILAQLPADSAQQLLAMARNPAPVADPTMVRRLEVEAASDPRGFAALDLSTRVDPRTPEFRSLSGLQTEVQRTGVAPDRDGILAVHAAATRVAAADAQQVGHDDNAAWSFETALAARVRATAAATGRSATPDEIDRQAELLQRRQVSGRANVAAVSPAPAPAPGPAPAPAPAVTSPP